MLPKTLTISRYAFDFSGVWLVVLVRPGKERHHTFDRLGVGVSSIATLLDAPCRGQPCSMWKMTSTAPGGTAEISRPPSQPAFNEQRQKVLRCGINERWWQSYMLRVWWGFPVCM